MARGEHPDWEILSVTFETKVQDVEKRFSLPKEIAAMLGVANRDYLNVSIDGVTTTTEKMQLVSDVEILDGRLTSGNKIRVTVSRI